MAFDSQLPNPVDSARNRRVVITGAGIVSAHGLGWEANARGFREGRDALDTITLFDTSKQRVHRGGEVRELPRELEARMLTNRQARRLDRASQLLLSAGYEAWDQSGWGDDERKALPPVIIGTSAGAMALGEGYFKQAHETPDRRRGQATRVNQYQPQSQVLHLCQSLELSSPISIISNACASGANAIGHAYHQIKWGHRDLAIAGGYDALCQLVFAGFDSLQALSPTLPRPFDANRDGLALGEGAAVLMLETAEHAEARGARILAELIGYGASTDVHHLTQPHPEGKAAIQSMTQACKEAGVSPEKIDYINAHGTGTPLNDAAEGAAINSWAGDAVSSIAVSSTKGGIGHLLGAAGAVETVISLMTLCEGWLPPGLHVETPDAICQFDLVTSSRQTAPTHVLTNSFGFGGSNATLILKRAS